MTAGMTTTVSADVIREIVAGFGHAGFGPAFGAVHEKNGKKMHRT